MRTESLICRDRVCLATGLLDEVFHADEVRLPSMTRRFSIDLIA